MFSAFNTFGKLGAPAGGRSLTLAQQIAAMSPSLWLEPSVTGGYQDSAGTTLVTQPGGGSADPPVGKALDLSGLGNHAIQSTSTARPKLSARVNYANHTESATLGNGITGWQSNVGGTLSDGRAGPLGGTPALEFTGKTLRIPLDAHPLNADLYLTFSARRLSGSGPITVADENIGTTKLTYSPTSEWAEYTCLINVPYGQNIWIVKSATDQTIQLCYPRLSALGVAYQRVTDASNYDYSGWPFVHVFDGVDDAHVITFPSSLGSACTVVTANRGTTPTIQTGQTIGTSYTISTTHAGKLIFNRALTAGETTIVTNWATALGALA